MKSHTGDKPFHCPLCPHRAKRKDHLKKHMETHGAPVQGVFGQVEEGNFKDGDLSLSTHLFM